MTKLEQIEQGIWREASRLALESYHAYCMNIHERLYLYSKNKELKVAADTPPGWQLAESETIPRNYTVAALVQWFNKRLRRLPIL